MLTLKYRRREAFWGKEFARRNIILLLPLITYLCCLNKENKSLRFLHSFLVLAKILETAPPLAPLYHQNNCTSPQIQDICYLTKMSRTPFALSLFLEFLRFNIQTHRYVSV